MHLNSARKFVGEAAHVLELCRLLADRGHDVSLAVRRGYVLEQRAREAGLHVVPLRMDSKFRPLADLRDARAIARHCREHSVEVLHAHRGKDHWLAAGAKAFWRLRAPLVRTRHVVTRLRTHFANRWLARRTAALLCVSGEVARKVAESGLYAPAKVRVVTGGVDLDRFTPGTDGAAVRRLLEIEPDAPVGVLVARFHPTKGHRYVVEAAERLATELPGAALLFVGEGSSMEETARDVRERGLDETVRFLGWRDDVADLLRAADVGILASVGSEGSSRAVMEYMASGIAVVATKVGAVPELVVDGETGLLVEPRDSAALAGAIRRLLGDSGTARSMGARGRAVVEERFGFETWADGMERFYGELLDAGGSAEGA